MKVITIQRHQQYEDSNATDAPKHEEPIKLKEAVDYISNHGYHFTEVLMNYATSKMENADGSTKRITKDTVDDRVHNILANKQMISDYMIDGDMSIRKNPQLFDMLLR